MFHFSIGHNVKFKSFLKFKFEFQNSKKQLPGYMVDRYLSTKFGINMLDGFSENAFYRRTQTSS